MLGGNFLRYVLILSLGMMFVWSELVFSQDEFKSGDRRRGRKKRSRSETSGETLEPMSQQVPVSSSSTTSNDADEGDGKRLHTKQEGKMQPYRYELSFSFSYSQDSTTTKSSFGGEAKQTLSGVGIMAAPLFIFGSFAAGPAFSYQSTTASSDSLSTNSSSTSFGGLARYYFGSLDRDVLLPYVSGTFASGSQKTSSDSADSSRSATTFGVGGGIVYFLASHLAVAPEFTYTVVNAKAEETTSDTSGFAVLGSLRVFL